MQFDVTGATQNQRLSLARNHVSFPRWNAATILPALEQFSDMVNFDLLG